MRYKISAMVVIGAGIASLCGGGPVGAEGLPKGITFCADGSDQLCPIQPADITIPAVAYKGLGANQAFFENFAWQSFVALNWPADAAGNPVGTRFGAASPYGRVWEHYPDATQVFGEGGGKGACTDKSVRTFGTNVKNGLLGHLRKRGGEAAVKAFLAGADPRISEFLQATGQPVIDRDGNYAVFEIRVSQPEEGYIKDNGLTTATGQKQYPYPIMFPPPHGGTDVGAIEIKASWRVLAKDDPRYYTIKGQVELDGSETDTKQPACLKVTLGLVGMHIIAKPLGGFKHDDWTWSTIEHIDNAPLAKDAPQPVDGEHQLPPMPCDAVAADEGARRDWAFYNPSCKAGNDACPLNTPATEPQDGYRWKTGGPPYAPSELLYSGIYGTQAARCIAVYDETAALNDRWMQKITQMDPTGPWRNYFVVGTQWEAGKDRSGTEAASKASVGDDFEKKLVPRLMANTTMETYVQTGMSCMECHQGAPDLAGKDANFSFFLNRANPN